MKLDLTQSVRDIRNNDTKQKASDVLANELGLKTSVLPFAKATRIAKELAIEGICDIAPEDLRLLEQEIEVNSNLFNFTKAEIVRIIDEAKNKEATEKKKVK